LNAEKEISLQTAVEAPHLAFQPTPSPKRRATHRDLRLLGTFTHVVEIDGPGKKDVISHATKRLGILALLLDSESPPKELYLALFADFICLALVSEKAIQAQSRVNFLQVILPPLVLVLSSRRRLLRVILVGTDISAARRHRHELWRWVWAQRVEFLMAQCLYLGIFLTLYFMCIFLRIPSWSQSCIRIVGPGLLLWAKLLGAVISIHHSQLGPGGRMFAKKKKKKALHLISFVEGLDLMLTGVRGTRTLVALMAVAMLAWAGVLPRLLMMFWEFLSRCPDVQEYRTIPWLTEGDRSTKT
jgi:hypothetical protein